MRDDPDKRTLGTRITSHRSNQWILLTAANQAALSAHGWPGNFDDLQLAARRLVAVVRASSLRKAADALDVGYSTLQHWFSHLGLSQPVLAGPPRGGSR